MVAAVDVLLIAYLLILTIQAIRWVRLTQGLPELEPQQHATAGLSSSLVSVIVPARNESKAICHCLLSLTSQDYPNLEIIVVDDESTDKTAAEARRCAPSANVIRTPSLPQGWVGKSWACHNGFLVSRGEYLFFTDADAVLMPRGLAAGMAHVTQNRVDMLTVWPHMQLDSFWERLILPIVFRFFFVDFRGPHVNDPASRRWAGFGMYILMKRDAYTTIGGHASIRAHTDEDYRLAERVRKSGLRLRVLGGERILRKRMYESLSGMWEGWVKNSFAGFDYRLGACLRSMAALAAASVLPALMTLVAAGLLLSGVRLAAAVAVPALLLYAVVVVREAMIRSQMGYPSHYALLTFVGETLFIAMNLASAVRTLTGRGVSWKGRSYQGRPRSDDAQPPSSAHP